MPRRASVGEAGVAWGWGTPMAGQNGQISMEDPIAGDIHIFHWENWNIPLEYGPWGPMS